MPTDPDCGRNYAIVYEPFGGGYLGVYAADSPDATVGRKVRRIYDINPETGELTEHSDRSKATVEQVREFVQDLYDKASVHVANQTCHVILDFIDNGPKKRNPVETVYDNAEGDITISQSRTIVQALREAGYLKDEA